MRQKDPGWKLRNAQKNAETAKSADNTGLSTKIITFCILAAVGGSAGYWIGINMNHVTTSMWVAAAVLMGLLLWIYGAALIHTVLHELGHLVFGLVSGYKLCSFRIGSKIWYKKDGATHTGRYSLPGTSGQCIMAPPEPADGKFPYVLFNLGGAMMNLLWAAVFLCLWALCKDNVPVAVFLLETAAVGAGMGLMNGIPMQPGGLNNDGRNVLELRRSPEAKRAFWVQLKTAEALTAGGRMADLPEEWFAEPPEGKWADPQVAGHAVCRAQWLLDKGDLMEVKALADRMLGRKTGLTDLHRGYLCCDRLCCELLGDKSVEAMARVRGTKQGEFNETMKDDPTVLRTEYFYTLLWKKDKAAADAIRAKFEDTAKTWPYSGEIESHRALMDLALARYKKEN